MVMSLARIELATSAFLTIFYAWRYVDIRAAR